MIVVVAALASVGAIVGVAIELNQTKASLGATRNRVSAAETKFADARSDLAATERTLANVVLRLDVRITALELEVGSSYEFGDLSSRVDDVEGEVTGLQTSIRDLRFDVSQVRSDTYSLAQCTNSLSNALRRNTDYIFGC